MELLYATNIYIQKVRHLKDLNIEIASDPGEMRHLILTGKNGSGKTSLLEALRDYLQSVSTTDDLKSAENGLRTEQTNLKNVMERDASHEEIEDIERRISFYRETIDSAGHGVEIVLSAKLDEVKSKFEKGHFILAYFGAKRDFQSFEPQHVEKVALKDYYGISDNTSTKFLSYALDLKVTQAMAIAKGDREKADDIENWFSRLQDIMRDIYEDSSLKIVFNEDSFKFSIIQDGYEPFDFNTASDGFSAILDIVVDLMIRMQQPNRRVTEYLMPGIVLIDEIENHLHLELQRKVLHILTSLFPNIQFIVTTHSPFILNSIVNATVYDLEKKILIKEGLSNASYSGIVEGYFDQDELSDTLRKNLERYRLLSKQSRWSDDELVEMAELEVSLDEIPDYIDIGIATEYKKLKLEMEQREG